MLNLKTCGNCEHYEADGHGGECNAAANELILLGYPPMLVQTNALRLAGKCPDYAPCVEALNHEMLIAAMPQEVRA